MWGACKGVRSTARVQQHACAAPSTVVDNARGGGCSSRPGAAPPLVAAQAGSDGMSACKRCFGSATRLLHRPQDARRAEPQRNTLNSMHQHSIHGPGAGAKVAGTAAGSWARQQARAWQIHVHTPDPWLPPPLVLSKFVLPLATSSAVASAKKLLADFFALEEEEEEGSRTMGSTSSCTQGGPGRAEQGVCHQAGGGVENPSALQRTSSTGPGSRGADATAASTQEQRDQQWTARLSQD